MRKRVVFLAALLLSLILATYLTPTYSIESKASQHHFAVIDTVIKLEANFYNPQAINYPRLLNIALASAQEYLKRHGIKTSVATIDSELSPIPAMKAFEQSWIEFISPHENNSDIAFYAITRLLASLNDSHTFFINPELWQDLHVNAKSATYGGIGALLIDTPDGVLVANIFPDSPASRQGLKQCDKILAVNGEEILSAAHARDLLRGPPNTLIKITIQRDQNQIHIPVVRQIINPKDLNYQMITQNNRRVLYFQLFTFTEPLTINELNQAIAQYQPDAIIMDLRYNTGGDLSLCTELMTEFLPQGTELYTTSSFRGSQTYRTAVEQKITLPLVVLINGYSASGAEIFASVMQQNQRATIIGEVSAGAVSVGIHCPIGNEAGMSVTVLQLVTTNHTVIEGIGIKPDIIVPFILEEFWRQGDRQLQKAMETLTTP